MFWLGKLNNKKLIDNAKDLVKLVEDNLGSELLLDKLQNIEHHYQSIEQYQRRYEFQLHEMINNFNAQRLKHFEHPYVEHSRVILEESVKGEYGMFKEHTMIIIKNHFKTYVYKVPVSGFGSTCIDSTKIDFMKKQEAYRDIVNEFSMKGMINIFQRDLPSEFSTELVRVDGKLAIKLNN